MVTFTERQSGDILHHKLISRYLAFTEIKSRAVTLMYHKVVSWKPLHKGRAVIYNVAQVNFMTYSLHRNKRHSSHNDLAKGSLTIAFTER